MGRTQVTVGYYPLFPNTFSITGRNAEFVSVDGVTEAPAWTAPYWNDAIAQFKGDEQDTSNTLFLGRVTYQGFAAAWLESKDEGADYMNNIPKYVMPTTLES